jgi:murein L,D-transpeptidase YcbB/YkuD
MAALSVSLEARVEQLRAILEHLRGTPYYRSRSRIVVNVPGFYLEYFRDGRLVSRHRTIVGAIRVGRDGRVLAGGRINATPLLSGSLTSLVLNPSWHVPHRIKDELDRLAAKNPDFYDAYRLYVDNEGNQRVVQPPGPDSALGRVKMAFPNNLGIFLHDTPHKDLFSRSVRAYSHGCVRVENATDLARKILDDDPHTMSAQQATQLLRTYFETPVKLTRPIEVHIEYVTAGTNEAGEFRFFPDLYQLGPARRARVR